VYIGGESLQVESGQQDDMNAGGLFAFNQEIKVQVQLTYYLDTDQINEIMYFEVFIKIPP
jgi:hypothetical protein